MSHINNSQSLSIRYHFNHECRFCNISLTDKSPEEYERSAGCNEDQEHYKFWGDPCIGKIGRENEKLHVFQCCETCSNHDIELNDALDNKRRFTQIEINRCICGAVKLWSIDCCVKCSIRSRMISRAEAEQKLMSKALVELRRTLKKCRDLTQTTEI